MQNRRYIPTKKWLNEYFVYHKNGYLIRKKKTAACTFIGQKVFGTKHHTGYRFIRIKNKTLMLHRVIFKLHRDFVPKILDHINRNKDDNRIENLRISNHSNNSLNSKLNCKNSSGHKGLSFDKSRGYWVGSICLNGKRFKTGFTKDKRKALIKLRALQKNKTGEFLWN